MIINIFILIIALFILGGLIVYFYKKRDESPIYKSFLLLEIFITIYILPLFIQIILLKFGINPIYCDYVAYAGGISGPVAFLQIALNYEKNRKVNIAPYFIIPVISLFVLWTNDFHGLFFETYSTNISEVVYGKYFMVHSLYSYIVMLVAIVKLIVTSVKKSGFFSNQTALIVFSGIIPLLTNMLGTMKIIPMSIYITPVTFMISSILIYIAVIKLKALSIIPVGVETVVQTMSDAYVLISNDGTIVDKNVAFEKHFSEVLDLKSESDFIKLIKKSKVFDAKRMQNDIAKSRKTEEKFIVEEFSFENDKINKVFQVEFKGVKARYAKEYIATLILFKDITQHKKDIQTIKDKQDVIVKQGQLVSIGELAGGVAHDINTPISAIKTGLGLLEEIYQNTDREITENEKQLLFRMNNCADKIIKIVNSMRNQIRNLGSDTKENFKVSEIIHDVKIIAFNELQKNKCDLEINIFDDLYVNGSPTKLSQVFTNLIINAMQAYNGKGGRIVVNVRKAPKNKVLIEIADYAGGIPDSIKESVFKNILTTKGVGGTGLGLYLAYSVIKGEFGGEITFESEKGQGTTFYIYLERASNNENS